MATNKFNHSDTTNQADMISALLTKGDTTQTEIMDLIRVGGQLHFIKDNSPHGGFINRLTELGISHRSALHSMRAALKFGTANTPRAAIAKTSIGKTKLILLARLDEITLDLLASGGAYNDFTLDDILRMSVRELQKIIYTNNESVAVNQRMSLKQDNQSIEEDENEKINADADADADADAEFIKCTERKKQYCRELFRVLIRHVEYPELQSVKGFIEGMISGMLTQKYNPGLNAASYDVFNRYVIKGRVSK